MSVDDDTSTIDPAPQEPPSSGPVTPPEDDAPGTDLVPADDVGWLTIKPGQRILTPDQKAAFSAVLNFDPEADKRSWPHINVFIQVCQELNLSPWQRKLYLIKRGKGDYATYTIQTGIHGLLELAERTSRFRRFVKVLWTGADDDPDSWYLERDADTGLMVRHRIYVDTWIWKDRNPAAAKCWLEYLDAQGNVQVVEATAHWGMFAPYNPVYEGASGHRYKKTDADGNQVMELADMWARDGGAHQIGKCARAQALRMAFAEHLPANVFIDEEMHKADAEVRAKAEEAAQGKLRQAYTAAQDTEVTVEVVKGEEAARPQQGAGDRRPDDDQADPDDQDVPVGAPEGPVDEPTRRAWIMAEIATVSSIMSANFENLLKVRAGANLEDISTDDLISRVGSFRPFVANRLREVGHAEEAAAYEQWPSATAAPVEVLFGHHQAAAPTEQAHAFVQGDGDGCAAPLCGQDTEAAVHASTR